MRGCPGKEWSALRSDACRMDVPLHFCKWEQTAFMSLSCSSLFDIGRGIQIAALVFVSQWLVRAHLLAHVCFV